MPSKAPHLKALSERHELFLLEYLRDRNGGRAYRAAGFSNSPHAKQAAWQLLRDPLIAARLKELTKEKFAALHMEVDEILARTAMIARSDLAALTGPDGSWLPLQELDETATAMIASIEHEEVFKGEGKKREKVGTTRKVRLRDPMPAIRLLAEYKKMVKTPDAGVNALASMLAERMKAAREARKTKDAS